MKKAILQLSIMALVGLAVTACGSTASVIPSTVTGADAGKPVKTQLIAGGGSCWTDEDGQETCSGGGGDSGGGGGSEPPAPPPEIEPPAPPPPEVVPPVTVPEPLPPLPPAPPINEIDPPLGPEELGFQNELNRYGMQPAFYGGLMGACKFSTTFSDGVTWNVEVFMSPVLDYARVDIVQLNPYRRPSYVNVSASYAEVLCDRNAGNWRN